MYLTNELLPARGTPATSGIAATLGGLDSVYAFVYARVGNRSDAEDLTQQVAVKALPRLNENAEAGEIRGYLFAAARSVLATFWSRRLRLPEAELPDNVRDAGPRVGVEPAPEDMATVTRILDALRPEHRILLELRFLRGYSLREVAQEMGKSVGSVKIMQLRALRRAAAIGSPTESRGEAMTGAHVRPIGMPAVDRDRERGKR